MRTVVLLAFFMSPVLLPAQYFFAGTAPDQFHGGIVYLDVLDSHEEIRLISDDGMIFKSAAIDSAGNFQLSGQEFSGDAYLCRIRFARLNDLEVSMNFSHRHFITFMTSGQDTLLVEGLRVIRGNAASLAINELELGLDALQPALSDLATTRRAELLDESRKELLHATLNKPENPYAQVFALGHLNEPSLSDLRVCEDAVLSVPLLPSFADAIRLELGGLEYQRLSKQNGWLKLALAVLLLVLFASNWLLWRRQPSPAKSYMKPFVLTDKEQEVMALITEGLSNREVAERLFVAENTVKTHINNLYKKLEVKNRKAAVDRWLEIKSTGD